MKDCKWYEIEATCIEENSGITARLGEKKVVAKVESYGLAYVSAMAISETLGKYFSIAINSVKE